jgi:hypothetical protein
MYKKVYNSESRKIFSCINFLGATRITALLEYHPFFWIDKKYMKECELALQIDLLQSSQF